MEHTSKVLGEASRQEFLYNSLQTAVRYSVLSHPPIPDDFLKPLQYETVLYLEVP